MTSLHNPIQPTGPEALSRRRWLATGALGLAMALGAGQAGAQALSNKPLRVLVGYSAGGAVDAMARLLAQGLATELNQQVVVENRAGASGLIAADLVSRSPADGHTLLLGESGLLIASLLQPGQRLDPLNALVPVAGLFTTPLMIVANNDFPARNPKELVAALKQKGLL